MSGIRLKGTGSALPRQVVTNRDLQRIVETDDAWIVSRTGIRERRKCRDETQSSLAEAAARAAMVPKVTIWATWSAPYFWAT